MSPSSHWKLVDVFTLEQAAYLWCDQEPGRINIDYRVPEGVRAIYQALAGASTRGDLKVDSSTNVLSQFGDLAKTVVSREELVKFAKSKNAYPEFLFDTLSTPEWTQAPNQTPTEPLPEPVNRGGRPEEYDWNACMAEIVRLADMDGLPAVQNELVRHLIGWFEERHGKSPADSVIKSRISPIYRYLKNVGWKSKNG